MEDWLTLGAVTVIGCAVLARMTYILRELREINGSLSLMNRRLDD